MRRFWSSLVLGLVVGGDVRAQTLDGQSLFQKTCASCHATGASEQRAPTLDALRLRSPEAVLSAMLTLTAGNMWVIASRLTGEERRAIAEYVTGKKFGSSLLSGTIGRCAASPPMTDPFAGPHWIGWGANLANTRSQAADQAGVTAEQVPRLTLKWAFGFPDTAQAWAQPAVVGGRLFVGTQAGVIYAVDAKTGCTIWTFAADTGVRTGIAVGGRGQPPGSGTPTLYFGDMGGHVYAVDAETGKLHWKQTVETHPSVRLTGTPTFFENRIYVPVSSYEESQAVAGYDCCTFRGSVVSLDADTGRVVWKTYMIADEPRRLDKSPAGVQVWGPSGAAIWAAPTIDVMRRALYVGTGNNYSGPQQTTTDAILALNLETGKVIWSRQMTSSDVWNPTIRQSDEAPDFDFGSSPILVTVQGRDMIVAGQKSGIVWALDPARNGEVLWKYVASAGGLLGGIEWGGAADERLAYFPVSDVTKPQPGGLHAVSLATGKRVWFAPPQLSPCGALTRSCNAAQSAAITAIPGAVFSGAVDGVMRAYSTSDGSVIWQFDTNRDFKTLNGIPAKGGSMNGAGPTIAGGMVYVSSGYGTHGGRPGNVLLAFGVD